MVRKLEKKERIKIVRKTKMSKLPCPCCMQPMETNRDEWLAIQARFFGYRRISFKKDWTITFEHSAIKLMSNAARMARAEGMIGHAKALECRMEILHPESRYRVGRLKNGVQTAEVIPNKRK